MANAKDSHCSRTTTAAANITPTRTKITFPYDILYFMLLREMVGIRETIRTLTNITHKHIAPGRNNSIPEIPNLCIFTSKIIGLNRIIAPAGDGTPVN